MVLLDVVDGKHTAGQNQCVDNVTVPDQPGLEGQPTGKRNLQGSHIQSVIDVLAEAREGFSEIVWFLSTSNSG